MPRRRPRAEAAVAGAGAAAAEPAVAPPRPRRGLRAPFVSLMTDSWGPRLYTAPPRFYTRARGSAPARDLREGGRARLVFEGRRRVVPDAADRLGAHPQPRGRAGRAPARSPRPRGRRHQGRRPAAGLRAAPPCPVPRGAAGDGELPGADERRAARGC